MVENDLSDAQKESLKKLRDEMTKNVVSWSDLYGYLHSQVDLFNKFPNHQTIFNALYTHRAFVLALQDLPEEGDAVEILKRMAFIMMFDSERLGAKLHLMGETPNINVVVIDKEALAQLQATGELPEQPQTDDAPKKILH